MCEQRHSLSAERRVTPSQAEDVIKYGDLICKIYYCFFGFFASFLFALYTYTRSISFLLPEYQ